MATRLRKLLIDRVDLVPRGANPDAHIALFKRDAEPGSGTVADMSTKEEDVTKNKDERPDLADVPEAVVKYLENVEAERTALADRVEKSETAVTELTAKVEKLEASGKPEDEIEKSELPEAVRKRFDELEARAKEAEEIAKAERETRERAEAIAKAKTFGVGEADKVGPALMKLDAESREVIEQTLKAAGEQLAKSALFSETGSARTNGGGDANDKLTELAKARASETKTTFHKAYAEILETPEGRELYTKSMQEKREAVR